MVKSIDNMSLEDALQELKEIATKSDRSDVSLDSAIKDFERGTLLKKHCTKILDKSKLQIEQITANIDGSITKKPYKTS